MRFKWRWGILVCLSVIGSASAEQRALILDDKDQAILRQILDAATKAHGTAIARATVYILDKLDAAPVVTEQKPKEDEKPKEPAQ